MNLSVLIAYELAGVGERGAAWHNHNIWSSEAKAIQAMTGNRTTGNRTTGNRTTGNHINENLLTGNCTTGNHTTGNRTSKNHPSRHRTLYIGPIGK